MDDERELEVIRHDMEQTRESLADKLHALEHTFQEQVEGATEAISHTVEAVQETVQTVKQTVTETFNVSAHVRRHPWLMLGGAFALGFLGGYLLGPSRKEEEPAEGGADLHLDLAAAPPANGRQETNGHRTQAAPAAEEQEESPLAMGLQMVQGMAVGALMGLLRETVARAVPSEWTNEVLNVVDDWTTRLGGKPLPRDQDTNTESPTTGETHHVERHAGEMGRPMGAARG